MLPFSKLFRVRNFLTENFVIFAYSNFKKATTMFNSFGNISVSYTHLRAHETRHDLVCRLLLEKKKKRITKNFL